MSNPIIITGGVKFQPRNLPVNGIRVELWDSLGKLGLLGSTHTDPNGYFNIAIPGGAAGDQQCTYLTFKGQVAIPNTFTVNGASVEIAIQESAYDDLITDPEIFSDAVFCNIHGVVTDKAKIPAANMQVKVFEVSLNGNTFLIGSITSHNGNYEIKIPARVVANAPNALSRCIVVNVIDSNANTIASSKNIYIVQESDILVDLTTNDEYKVPSLFENLMDAVNTVLAPIKFSDFAASVSFEDGEIVAPDMPGEVEPHEIDYDGSGSPNGDSDGRLSFLGMATGNSLSTIQNLVRSYQFSQEASMRHADMFALTRKGDLYTNPLLKFGIDQLEAFVREAFGGNIIPFVADNALAAYIDAFITAATAYIVRHLREIKVVGEQYTLENLLTQIFAGSVGIDGIINEFLARYNKLAGNDLAKFWEDYYNDHPDEAAIADRGIRIGELTYYQPELTGYLVPKTDGGLHLLALKTENDWRQNIEAVSGVPGTPNYKLCVPDSIKGELNDKDAIDLYAQKLTSVAQNLYPLTALKDSLTSQNQQDEPLITDPTTRLDVRAFIESNPSFDLRVANVYEITIQDFAAVRQDITADRVNNVQQALSPVQRVMRTLNGNPRGVAALMRHGITSARAVTSMPLSSFVATYGPMLGGSSAASMAYARGSAISSAAGATTVGAYSGAIGPVSTTLPGGVTWGGSTTGPGTTGPTADPNLTTLFGSMSYCACEQCLSVYSPAAYFTDILHFLEINNYAAYAELIRRRPDLPYIDMTCKNTNTPVPYIDLVNELLEVLILQHVTTATFIPASFQTNGTALELAAHPEHIFKHVISTTPTYAHEYLDYTDYTKVYDPLPTGSSYSNLTTAVYPFNLPFSLPAEETRTYLKYLGTGRYELMKLFQQFSLPGRPSSSVTGFDIYCELMGITETQASIINTTHASSSNTWLFYGFISSSVSNFIDPADSSLLIGTPTAIAWDALLADRLDVLIQQLKISYKEFLQFLTTDFLNKKPSSGASRLITVTSKIVSEPDTCDITKLKLVFASPATPTIFFGKLHRFARLWKTGIMDIDDWDAMFTALNITNLGNDADFELVGRVLTFSKRTGLTFKQLSGWWGFIDIHQYIDYGTDNLLVKPSVYDLLYRNRAVINQPDPNFIDLSTADILGFPASFPAFSISYTQYSSYIAAANNIKEDELFAILDYLAVPYALPGNVIDIAVLSKIFAVANLARSIHLSIKDFIWLLNITGIPLAATPGSWHVGTYITDQMNFLDTLLEAADALNRSNFVVAELSYLLENTDMRGNYAPANLNIQNFYEALRKDLQLFPELLVSGIGPSTSWPPAEVTLLNSLVNVISQHFSKEFNITREWVDVIFNSIPIPHTASPTDYALVISDLIDYRGFINTTSDLTEGSTVIPIAGIIDRLYDTYRYFYKLTYIATKLSLNVYELPHLLQSVTAVGDDFTSIPVSTTPPVISPSTSLFYALLQLVRWVDVKTKLQFIDDQLVTLWKAANTELPGSAPNPIFSFTTWQDIINQDSWGTMLTTLIGAPTSAGTRSGILDAYFGGDFKSASPGSVTNLWKIIEIISICKRTGLNPATLRNVVLQGVTLAQSHRILLAAKGKQTEQQWAKIAKPLMDTLRKKKRDALVGNVLNHPEPTATSKKIWRNENDLYAYLLIDVEMEACMKTSRIKQGICSIQLFVDRVTLGLESSNYSGSITMDAHALSQWESWREWYRIWEANRKIFLYPENWLEPELRDDKSVFFKEMEDVVGQGDMTADRSEDAILDYLRKLQTVARLEPMGSCRVQDPSTLKEVLHVVARTYSDPHEYFYRRLVDNEWTPWERIEMEIKSDHLVPFVFQGKLFLYWLTFREKSVVANPSNVNNMLSSSAINLTYWYFNDQQRMNIDASTDTNPVHSRQIEVTLNWSEYKDGHWRGHNVAKEKMHIDINPILEKLLAGVFGYPLPSSISWLHTTSFSQDVKDYYRFLTNKRSLSISELVISRFKFQSYSINNGNDLLLFVNACTDFLDTVKEDGKNLHAFLVPGDGRMPFVWDSWCGANYLAPSGTVFSNNKLVQWLAVDNTKANKPVLPYHDSLNIDNTQTVIVNSYAYPGEYIFTSLRQQTRLGTPVKILQKAPKGIYKVSNVADNYYNLLEKGFFYEDDQNNFCVSIVDPASYTSISDPVSLSAIILPQNNIAAGASKFYFQNFAHGHVTDFIGKLNAGGIDGFLNIATQDDTTDTMNFTGSYLPTSMVYNKYPINAVDFDFTGAYSSYNWELFFHTPLLIAKRLSANQQFEDARKWYHYIFDPTSSVDATGSISASKNRFWKFRPFYIEASATITTLAQLMVQINAGAASAIQQVNKWMDNPFKPHVIARMRLLAYMKNVVMCYLDNLIAWGDNLFRQDTIESINQATQLYIMAANILGERPQEIPTRVTTGPRNYTELDAAGLDAFSNAMVAIENFIDPNSAPTGGSGIPYDVPMKMFYFCLPNNPKLLAYWDTVESRLFNIRNCRNIDGVLQELPLFEPPIDPALLVRAAAAGLDVRSVLDDLLSPAMPYRFNVLLQKANEFCNDVKGLGSALLSALEKKDAEAMALLRSTHEIAVLESMKQMKKLQVDEADANIEVLNKSKDVTQVRFNYYSTRQYKSAKEAGHLGLLDMAQFHQNNAATLQAVASLMAILPEGNFQAPMAIGPSFGGRELSAMFGALSTIQSQKAAQKNAEATKTITEAGYERRMDDWQFQAQSAQKELVQMDKQIIAAQIRKAMAEHDLETAQLQIDNAREMDQFMREKFTNQELYSWMVSQLSNTYFQSYQMAYDMAKRAEKGLVFELPLLTIPATGYIRFGYWDSLKKGLLSGEKLQHDLRKMELAYLEGNTRELELTKHISLAIESPAQLLELRETGRCIFDCTDPSMFDIDYPGHYLRRIKSVSISIPCVAGPYTTIAATLTRGTWIIEDASGGVLSSGANYESVALSGGQNDSGVFELNLRDERYLPFEGTGAVADWSLQLMEHPELRQFDFNTISDVILHIRYTARYSEPKNVSIGNALASAVVAGSAGISFNRYFSLKHEFANAWFAYTKEYTSGDPHAALMTLKMSNDLFPYLCAGKTINVTNWTLVFRPKPLYTAGLYLHESNPILGSTDQHMPINPPITTPPHFWPTATGPVTAQIHNGATIDFNIALSNSSTPPSTGGTPYNINDVFEDIYLIVTYNLQP